MFEIGGCYAPYNAPRSPSVSVESGEVSEEEEVSVPPPPRLIGPPRTETPGVFSAVLCIRRREVTKRAETLVWFEFLFEKFKDYYQFPQAPGGSFGGILNHLHQRRLLNVSPDRIERYFETEVSMGRTKLRVYMLPPEATQSIRQDRNLMGAPRLYWLCESELATHDQVGAPSAFGVPVAPWALRTFYTLHPSLRFASPSPPLVLYHGTDVSNVRDILTTGLKPSPGHDAMLGIGVYFARWDKACDFAKHDAGNVPRPVCGLVIRCIVAPGSTLTMKNTMHCTCGCGKPYVDHHGDHSRGYRTVYVPDNSYGATRRAEWCVKEPDAIYIDSVFKI